MFGIPLRGLVLALFAYVGSGMGVSAVRTLEVFAGSEGESLPVLEATEVRRKTIHETHLHHRRFSERQRRKDSYQTAPSLSLTRQPDTFTSFINTSPPSLRAPPFFAVSTPASVILKFRLFPEPGSIESELSLVAQAS